jgi:hypothetical protein
MRGRNLPRPCCARCPNRTKEVSLDTSLEDFNSSRLFVCASGMTRSVVTDAVNRGAKAIREVTGRVQVLTETLMTGTPSRNARASAARRSPKEAAGKLLARRT